jgi:hypothetical protein
MVYAAYNFPWARTVERQANADIGDIESTLDDAERTYLDEHDRRFDTSECGDGDGSGPFCPVEVRHT